MGLDTTQLHTTNFGEQNIGKEGFSPDSPVFLPPQKPTLQIPI